MVAIPAFTLFQPSTRSVRIPPSIAFWAMVEAAAAGVLTAVDEDEEGIDEASAPKEFEYDTDEMEE